MAKGNRIVYGNKDVVDFMEGTRSLGEFIQKRLRTHQDRVLLIDAITGELVTARQLLDRSARVAECLRAHGVSTGSVVGLSTENRLEFAYVLIGALLTGATATGFNPTYTDGELEHVINLSKPHIVFASSASVKTVLAANKKSSNCHVVVFDGKDPVPVGALAYSKFLQGRVASDSQLECEPQDIHQHVGLILYSSGTTGLPKGVQLTQANSVWSIQRYYARNDPGEIELGQQIMLNIAPFFHTFGIHVLLLNVLRGNPLITLPCFDPHTYLGAIQKYKANSTSIAPPLMVFLAKSPLVDQYDISSMRIIFVGAAPLTKELQDAVFDRLKGPNIRNGYGMTEGTLAFSMQNRNFCKTGSVGQLYPGLQGRVADIETSAVLGANEEGELQFKNTTMKGYVGDENATRAMITDDGWLRSGDIGYFDEHGELFVVDRLKELIKFKGFQVAPAELEGIMLKNPRIADVGVIGIPDERAGELPFAFVVRQPNVELTEAEVVDYVARNTSATKQLRGGVRFVDSIPKNPSGKILRRELRLMFKSILKSKL